MVFQDPLSSLNPRRRVGDAVVRPLRLFQGLDQREAARRAAALFEDLGLEPALLSRFPRQLSGGQQQRVAIARAFAAEPDLLICDEITSALDASVQAQVLDHLAAMQRRQGTAMLLITHDLSVVWRMARRVAVMQGGRILETGETEAIFRNPANPYTAALLGAATRAARAGQPELVDATG
jgi:ABC-type glutathione transport system ATPase component